jgi:hypothetical protein
MAGSCTTPPQLATPTAFAAAVEGGDHQIYLLGGSPQASGSLTYNSTSTTCAEGANPPSAEVQVYTPSTNLWTTGVPMQEPRSELAAVVGSDGRIYAIGGGASSGSVEAYDLTLAQWSSAPSLLIGRQYFGATVGGDGRIYVVGGVNGAGATLTAVEAFRPGDSEWTSVAPLDAPMLWPAVAAGLDGRIYAFDTLHSSLEIFDPSVGSWITQSISLPTNSDEDCVGLAATTLSDGTLFLAGGVSNDDCHPCAWALAYDPGSSSFVAQPGGSSIMLYDDGTTSTAAPSSAGAILKTASGRVWALGGVVHNFGAAEEAFAGVTTVWLYDPSAAAWVH